MDQGKGRREAVVAEAASTSARGNTVATVGGSRGGKAPRRLPRREQEQPAAVAPQQEPNGQAGSAAEGGDSDDGDHRGAGRASYGDDLDTLDRRRTEELKLIGEYDS